MKDLAKIHASQEYLQSKTTGRLIIWARSYRMKKASCCLLGWFMLKLRALQVWN